MARPPRTDAGRPDSRAATRVIALVFVAIAGVGALSSGSPEERRVWVGAVAWFAAAACLQFGIVLLSIAVHELGHLVANLAVGFRVDGWRVWPVEVWRSPAGWAIRVSWNDFLAGRVAGAPLTLENLRARHAFTIAAGPAVHLALGFAIAAAALARPGPFLDVSAALVIALPLLGLAPMRRSSKPRLWNDGQWLRCWARDPQRAAQRVASGALQLAARKGDRPREWDEALVRLASTVGRRPVNPDQVIGSQLASLWALDRGDPSLAATFISRAVAGARFVTPSSRAVLAAQSAFLAARYFSLVEAAERLLASEPARTAATAIDVGLAEAAIHLARGRAAEAVEAADRTLDGTRGFRTSQSGIAVLVREQLDAVRSSALDALSPVPM